MFEVIFFSLGGKITLKSNITSHGKSCDWEVSVRNTIKFSYDEDRGSHRLMHRAIIIMQQDGVIIIMQR